MPTARLPEKFLVTVAVQENRPRKAADLTNIDEWHPAGTIRVMFVSKTTTKEMRAGKLCLVRAITALTNDQVSLTNLNRLVYQDPTEGQERTVSVAGSRNILEGNFLWVIRGEEVAN